MSPDAIAAVSIFLAAQTGALVWFLSSINTKQTDMAKTLDRVETSAHNSEIHLAKLPCQQCPQAQAGD